jgi:hypothetical protein
MQYLGMPLGTLDVLGNISAFLGVPDRDYLGVPVAFIPSPRVVVYWDKKIVLVELPRTSRLATEFGPDVLEAALAGRREIS